MIAFADEPRYKPSPEEEQIKKTLQQMTGLGVRIVPQEIGGFPTVGYVFKCNVPDGEPEAQAKAIHAMHDYIKQVMMDHAGAGYSEIALAHVADPDDLQNGMWPCVNIRISGLSGYPHPDKQALSIVKMLQDNLEAYSEEHYGSRQMAVYQKHAREGFEFTDAYARELGK